MHVRKGHERLHFLDGKTRSDVVDVVRPELDLPPHSRHGSCHLSVSAWHRRDDEEHVRLSPRSSLGELPTGVLEQEGPPGRLRTGIERQEKSEQNEEQGRGPHEQPPDAVGAREAGLRIVPAGRRVGDEGVGRLLDLRQDGPVPGRPARPRGTPD